MRAINRNQIEDIFRQKNLEPTREKVNTDTGDVTFFNNEKEIAIWEYRTKELILK